LKTKNKTKIESELNSSRADESAKNRCLLGIFSVGVIFRMLTHKPHKRPALRSSDDEQQPAIRRRHADSLDTSDLRALVPRLPEKTLTGNPDLNRLICGYLNLTHRADASRVMPVNRHIQNLVGSMRIAQAEALYLRSLQYASEQSCTNESFPLLLTAAQMGLFPPTNASDIGFFTDSVRIKTRREAWNKFLTMQRPDLIIPATEARFHRIMRNLEWGPRQHFKTGPMGTGYTL